MKRKLNYAARDIADISPIIKSIFPSGFLAKADASSGVSRKAYKKAVVTRAAKRKGVAVRKRSAR